MKIKILSSQSQIQGKLNTQSKKIKYEKALKSLDLKSIPETLLYRDEEKKKIKEFVD